MPSEIDGEIDAEVLEEEGLAELSDDDLSEDDLVEDDELVEDDDLADVDDLVDDDDDVEADTGTDVPLDDAAVVPVAGRPAVVAGEGEESAADDDEDELDDDDVEASLDVILKERLVVEDEEDEDEEDEVADAEDRGDGTSRVLPKQPGEFVCQSCFLVKNETQLADRGRTLCRDCV